MSKSIEANVLARAIVLLEHGWVHGVLASNAKGQEVRWDSKRAVNFCAVGALRRATKEVLGSYGKVGARLTKKIHSQFDLDLDDDLMVVNDYAERLSEVTDLFRVRIGEL